MRSTTVCAPMMDLLLLFVKSEALLRPVPPTANPAGDSAAAVVLVVSVPLATETPERLGSVGAQVKQAPVPQVYVRREGPADGDEDLSCLVLLSCCATAGGLLHLRVP